MCNMDIIESIPAMLSFVLCLSSPLFFCIHDLVGSHIIFSIQMTAQLLFQLLHDCLPLLGTDRGFIPRHRDLGQDRAGPLSPSSLPWLAWMVHLTHVNTEVGSFKEKLFQLGWPLGKHVKNFVHEVI